MARRRAKEPADVLLPRIGATIYGLPMSGDWNGPFFAYRTMQAIALPNPPVSGVSKRVVCARRATRMLRETIETEAVGTPRTDRRRPACRRKGGDALMR